MSSAVRIATAPAGIWLLKLLLTPSWGSPGPSPQVLESCMKSCGKRFHDEVGKFRFLNELIKVVSPKVGLRALRCMKGTGAWRQEGCGKKQCLSRKVRHLLG